MGETEASGGRRSTRCPCRHEPHLRPPSSQVPSSEYSFGALEAASVVPGRVQRLPRDAFRHEAQKQSLAFADIKKGGGAPPWYTSVADNHAVPTADLQMIHDAVAGPSFESKVMSNAFVGAVVDHRHRFVFRRTSGGAWLMPLNHMSESAALVWPMVGRSMPGYPDSLYFSPQVDLQAPVLISMYDLDMWEGVAYEAQSPASQWLDFPKARSSLKFHGVRLVASSPVRPLRELAARCGFWELQKPFLVKLADLLEVVLPEGSNLVDILWHLVQSCIPRATDQLVHSCIEHRMARMAAAVEKAECETFADCEGLQEVLEPRDEKSLQKGAKMIEHEKLAYEQVKTDFIKTAAAKGVGPEKLGKCVSAAGKAFPKFVPEGTIGHAEAKALCPPTAFVWRNVKQGRWCARQPPWGEVSRSWAKWGERESLLEVLKVVWEQFLMSKALPTKECPIKGLFS